MAKSVKGEEFVEKGALSQHIAETQKLIELYDKWDERIKQVAKDNKVIIEQLKTTNVKDVERLGKAQKEVNTATRNGSKIAQEKAKLEERLSGLRSREAKENERLKVQISERRRQLKAEAKDVAGITGEYAKQSRRLNNLRKDYKNLAAAGRENGKVARGMKSEIDKLDSSLKRIDKSVGQSQRNVGNYSSALGGLNGKFRSAIRMATQFGVAMSGVAIIRNATKVITDFDQAVTDLGAISGKTAKELKPLNNQAKELGATTQFTASEITGLQIELAKLGFTTQEITDSTGGIANFAAATGVEIPRAAALAGSALRAFGLETSEIDRVVSTLGVATTKTALDFSKLEAGLSTVAPVAASFGFSIEDTTALLGQLSNAGFDASSAATATRNILLNLADSGGSLAQALGRPVKNSKDLAEGLQELKSRGIDLAEALELTDKRSVAAFNTFIENSDTLEDLSASITDVNGELTDMADKRLDSVQGQLKLLNSAWEGFILGTGESAGAVEFLKSALGFLAENLTTIISTIGKLMAVYAIWIVRQKVINSGMIDYIRNIPKAVKGTKNLSTNISGASSNASKFGKALTGIGWTALIGLAFELAKGFWEIASGANEAAFQSKVFNAAQEEGRKQAGDFVSERTKGIDQLIKQGEQELTLLRERGATEEEIANKELELRNKIADARKSARRDIQTEISVLESQYSSQLKTLETLGVNIDKLPEQLDDAGGSWSTFFDNIGSSVGDASLGALFGGLTEAQRQAIENDAQLNKQFAESSTAIQKLVALRNEEKNIVGTISDDAFEIQRTELKRQGIARGTTKEYKKQSDEIKEFGSKQDELFEKQLEANTSDYPLVQIEFQYREQLKSVQNFHEKYLSEKREVFGQEAELTEAELEAINDLYRDAEDERNKAIREAGFQNLQMNQDLTIQELELDKQIAENKKASADEIKKIEDEILQAKIDRIDQEIAYLEERNDPLDQKRIEVLEKEKEAIKSKTDVVVESAEREVNAYQSINDAFKLYADERIKKLDEEISKIDELIEASKKRESELSELRAKEGADVAESLAFEQQKQAEALARKEELERKKRRTELATAVINLVSSKIEQGSTNATGEAFAEIASIQGFIQSLPTFWGGTDTTIGDAVGMKYSNDRDGVIVRADPSEMILNKDKVDELRGMGINRTDDIVNVAKMWKQSGAIQYNNDYNVVRQTAPMFNSKVMEQELKGLKSENEQIKGYLKSINEKPAQVFDVKKMGDYVDLISKKVEGNKTTRTYKRFR